jgi:hypothetical protein
MEFELLFQCRRSPKEKPMSTRQGNLLFVGPRPAVAKLDARLFEPAMKASEGKNNAETLSLQRSGEDTKRDRDPNLNFSRGNFLR